MDAVQMIADALSAGLDKLFDAGLALVGLYAVYLVARLRTVLLSGVPAAFQAVAAGLIEQMLQPIVTNAVKHAEEYGAKLKADVQAKIRYLTTEQISAQKLQAAKQYIAQTWVPDWILSDAKVEAMIDAALVSLGQGASKGITIGVDIVTDKIGTVQPPELDPAA